MSISSVSRRTFLNQAVAAAAARVGSATPGPAEPESTPGPSPPVRLGGLSSVPRRSEGLALAHRKLATGPPIAPT